MDVFWSDDDRLEYLGHIRDQGKRFGVRYEAWYLMTNHVHLVAVPEEARSLALGIGEAHRRYTRSVDFRQGERGYLFQGRFSSCVLDEPHLIATIRYIERNPVRARMVRRPWDWSWSSARFRVREETEDRLVGERDPFGVALDWRELLLEDPREVDFIREQSRTGRPCGSDAFIIYGGVSDRPEAPAFPGRSPAQTTSMIMASLGEKRGIAFSGSLQLSQNYQTRIMSWEPSLILQGTILPRTIVRPDPKDPGKKKTLGPYYQWTFKQAGKTTTVNLTPSQAKAYQKAIDNQRRMERIIQEMRQLSLRILEDSTVGVRRRKPHNRKELRLS